MIMSPDDYSFLYGKLESTKIPDDIHTKIMEGEDLNPEEETRIKAIIEKEKPKKPVEIIGYGMMCPTCKLKYLKMKDTRCERCNQKLVW